MNNKQIANIYTKASRHWVGDGFPVQNFLPTNNLERELSPFLLLDYAGPANFDPTKKPRGVGEHPHRGFETVTIVYQGKVAHRDSAGNHGVIGPGDVQWMTAASGVVHEEMHDQSFAEQGGTLEMIQLWVNLPKALKMSAPRYQTLLNQQIPKINLSDSSYLRIISGEYKNKKGPANTFTPVNLYDVFLAMNDVCELIFPENTNTGLFLLDGELTINNNQRINKTSLILFETQGQQINLTAQDDARFLILNGESIDEPIARHGPFVMNTEEEIQQAMMDYMNGKLGRL